MKQLQASIVSAAKLYISDNKYNIEFNGSCDDSSSELMIRKINDLELTESHLLLDTLVNEGYLKTNAGNIINPENDKNLDLNASYITIQYSCQTKIFDYDDEPNLIVQE